MNKLEFKELIKKVYLGKKAQKDEENYKEYRVLKKVPTMVPILVDLLSEDFSTFVEDIDWVAPKPPTFRIILANEQFFYLTDMKRSWVAEIEGKKYYLLNLGEEERATSAIARLLRYAKPEPQEEFGTEPSAFGTEPTPSPFSPGGETPGPEDFEAELAGEETPTEEVPAEA